MASALVESVDDDGEGAVAGDVACGAEVIHGDVEGNHDGLFLVAEAEHGAEHAEGGHDGAARHAGGGYHDDAEHEDEAGHLREVHRGALHHHDGHGAGHDFEGAAGEVDGGAEGHHKAGHIAVHAVGNGLAQGDGNGGGAGLCAQGGEVGGQHVQQQGEGISAGNEAGNAVLEDEHANVQHEDDADDADEDVQNAHGLPGVGHVERDAEDEERQQRDDDDADGAVDDFPQVLEYILQRMAAQVGHAQPQQESQHQRGHHAHERRNLDAEVGCGIIRRCQVLGQGAAFDEPGEEGDAGEIGEEAGYQRGQIGQRGGAQQQLAGFLADVGNGGGHQPHDEQRDDEAEELAEQPVEGDEYAGEPERQHIAQQHACHHGDDDAGNQSNLEFLFHTRKNGVLCLGKVGQYGGFNGLQPGAEQLRRGGEVEAHALRGAEVGAVVQVDIGFLQEEFVRGIHA